MTTKRLHTKATARMGVNFAKSVIETQNCIFQEVDLENDIGNDAYIEFIQGEDGTGCCIANQIKSGESYVAKSGNDFVLKSDRDHFEYWNSHVLPVAGIVYDPDEQRAAWVNISLYLEEHPGVVADGPYNIPVLGTQSFSNDGFAAFRNHFLDYAERYRTRDAFARTVDSFLEDDNTDKAASALRSLFYYHRKKRACWYMLMTSLSFCGNPKLLEWLTYYLALVPDHGDIYWHKDNLLDPGIKKWAAEFMCQRFRQREVEALLTPIDPEQGIGRGTIGQCAHAIVAMLPGRREILAEIIADADADESVRWHAVVMLAYEVQCESVPVAKALFEDYLRACPSSIHSGAAGELCALLNEGHTFDLY
jgi:hypothetical protein